MPGLLPDILTILFGKPERLLDLAGAYYQHLAEARMGQLVLYSGVAMLIQIMSSSMSRSVRWPRWFSRACWLYAAQAGLRILELHAIGPSVSNWTRPLGDVLSGVNNVFYFFAAVEWFHWHWQSHRRTMYIGAAGFLAAAGLSAVFERLALLGAFASAALLLGYARIYWTYRKSDGPAAPLVACAIGTVLLGVPQVFLGTMPVGATWVMQGVDCAALIAKLDHYDVVATCMHTNELKQIVQTFLLSPTSVWNLLFSFPFVGGAVLLLARSIRQGQTFLDAVRTAQASVKEGDPLSQGAVARAAGTAVGADVVDIVIRTPGSKVNKVVWYSWNPTMGATMSDPEHCPDPEDSVVGNVLKTGKTQCRYRLRAGETGYLARVKGMCSYVAVPITVNGAVVGCLNVEWMSPYAWSRSTRARLEEWASQLAPLVQAAREFQALERLVYKAPEFDADPDAAGTTTSALGSLTSLVDDTLAPGYTIVALLAGFRQRVQRSREGSSTSLQFRRGQALDAILQVSLSERSDLERVEVPLRAVGLDFPLGTLALGAPRGSDQADAPYLGRNPSVRRAAAALVAAAVLDTQRIRLFRALEDARKGITGPERVTVQSWFAALEELIRRAGLIWIVAEVPGESSPLGSVEIASKLATMRSDSGERSQGPVRLALPEPIAEAALVVRLDLSESGGHLYLGVSNPNFGPELDDETPWSEFLKRLQSLAAETLEHLLDQREILQNQALLVEAHALAALGRSPWMEAHDLVRELSPLAVAAEGLHEDLRMRADVSSIAGGLARLARDAREMVDRVKEIRDAVRVPDTRPCDLNLILGKVLTVREPRMRARGVTVHRHGPTGRELLVDARGLHLAFALSTVLDNAFDVLERNPQALLVVTTEHDGEALRVRVEDNGPGIPEHVQRRLFQERYSSKPNGAGSALLFACRWLAEDGAVLSLVSSRPGATIFEIHLHGVPHDKVDQHRS